MPIPRHIVPIEPLDAGEFRRYGDVIEASDSAEHFTLDQGTATRYHDSEKVGRRVAMSSRQSAVDDQRRKKGPAACASRRNRAEVSAV